MVHDKTTGAPFNGTLPQPLLLISSTTDLQISPVSSVLVVQGEAVISLRAEKPVDAYVSVNL